MPTVTVDLYESLYIEMADRLESLQVAGTNRHGMRSHVFAPADGATGAVHFGVCYRTYAPSAATKWEGSATHEAFAVGIGYPAGQSEGPYVKTWAGVFKDLGIPRGATIQSATWLKQIDDSVEPPAEDKIVLSPFGITGAELPTPGVTYYAKAFGLLNPAFFCRILPEGLTNGYDGTSQIEHWAHFGYRRRWRVTNRPEEQRHTEAVVQIPLTTNTASNVMPDLSPIVQEIVNQPGWKPNNKLAIMFHPGDQLPGATWPTVRCPVFTYQTNLFPRLSVTYT